MSSAILNAEEKIVSKVITIDIIVKAVVWNSVFS